ncbi:SRPBCC domain-containing protein [Dactylosporangium matsuzakiense]|uniref:Activator of Hsp90 ATPase homologue 1/2-like C-terminal domain-containing protein n=1 Tax=Dactylosporangium matsuzakiense TaxID=53360 RepID=A0A9W6KDZ6_9ACTN|nr:SRPBCC domain-containing protein [Dactylosporangium matsuzakiense]UWZ47253.1 SRPBCC domain-containing protein [Dactylosporangium matsuzakiense]GLK98294.1 hypothetical protein GCM10017581_000350 [Dactylosporangium matsuzakiense]
MTVAEFVDGASPVIRVVRTYDHPIERVWRAVTAPEHLAAWFPTGAEMDLVPGGKIRFGDLGDGGSTGEVLLVEPPNRLDFRWGDQRFEFHLAAAGGTATTFTLVHHFDDRAGAASFATGWELCLRALAAALDGAPPPPADRGAARHEELVRAFGLDRPRVTRDGDGWHVRFERQLTCSADAAREVLGPAADGERLAFAPGTGHGARLVVEFERTDETAVASAVALWTARIEGVSAAACDIDGGAGDEGGVG